MFDWARGTQLKEFIERREFNASWDLLNSHWLKNWSVPWALNLIRFCSTMKVLDVGSATPWLMQHIHRRFGSEVHALDVEPNDSMNANFGFASERLAAFPDVRFHFGMAGKEVLPADTFDVVVCISVIEHTYDHSSPLDPDRPLAHVNVLRDLVRMVKPGGILLMNWDVYLQGVEHHVGWDFEADFALLRHCGLDLVTRRRRVRGKEYIASHADTLFFDRRGMTPATRLDLCGTSINMLWRKPGRGAEAVFGPDPTMAASYFPDDEASAEKPSREEDLTTNQIDLRFHRYMEKCAETLGNPRYRASPVFAAELRGCATLPTNRA
jgi:SAM-dependent methyltransferase